MYLHLKDIVKKPSSEVRRSEKLDGSAMLFY